MLRQPIEDSLAGASSVLLAGAGGGYDLVGAIPLLIEMRRAGKSVHLASLTFTDFRPLQVVRSELPNLVAISSEAALETCYCPEAWLSRWLANDLGLRQPVWLLEKTGVRPLRLAYQHLVSSLGVDAIVLVDGGIDAVLRGDETSIGTPGEDLATLAAVSGLSGPTLVLACLGMTAELRDGIVHAQFLGRVAELTGIGAFLGTATLSALTEAGQAYMRALAFITSHQANLRQSHVQRVVLDAMAGGFGARGEYTWLSPLLTLYWFFNARSVASTHLFLAALENTDTAWQVSATIEGLRKTLPLQERSHLPV